MTHTTLLWQELAPLLRLISDLKMLLLMLSAYLVPLLAILGFGILLAALMHARPRRTRRPDARQPRAWHGSPAHALRAPVLRIANGAHLHRAGLRNGNAINSK